VTSIMTPGRRLDPMVDLASVALIGHYQQLFEVRSREKARDEPTIGQVVGADVLDVVY
jgi:hypothetical protein